MGLFLKNDQMEFAQNFESQNDFSDQRISDIDLKETSKKNEKPQTVKTQQKNLESVICSINENQKIIQNEKINSCKSVSKSDQNSKE